MSLSRIDLNLFVVFETIYDHGSLTRAAEVLHVTQPAVSNSLARLRTQYNDPLFVRSPVGMSPTPLARQLIGPVKEALQILNGCVSARIEFIPATAQQTFRVHATEYAETRMLPRLLSFLADSAPGINLEVVFLSRRDVPLALASGELHLSLDAPLLNHPELEGVPLLSDPYICTFRPGHPLLKNGLTLKQYLAAEHLHVSSRVKGSGHVDVALRSAGYKRRIALRLQHYAAAPQILKSSNLIASIPAGLAKDWSLPTKRLPLVVPAMELQMSWHRRADHDPGIAWLRQTIMALAD